MKLTDPHAPFANSLAFDVNGFVGLTLECGDEFGLEQRRLAVLPKRGRQSDNRQGKQDGEKKRESTRE